VTRHRAAPLLVVAALTACERAPAAGDAAVPPDWKPASERPAELARGEQVFAARCASCHGELALGTEQGPPLLHIYYEPDHHADAAFLRAVQFGVQPHHWDFGPMPPVEGIARADVDAVTAYVRWLQREAGIY
jgi:mono/diheme cytochrome c family protein